MSLRSRLAVHQDRPVTGDAYTRWQCELLRLARDADVEWLVVAGSQTHRAAFDRGCSPEDELASLQDMAEWRGCGCGGGG